MSLLDAADRLLMDKKQPTTHSPGPWRARLDAFPVEVVLANGCVVAECATDDTMQGEAALANELQTLADARLIAAAPDMADAITFALADSCGLSDAACDKLRAALAKAGVA